VVASRVPPGVRFADHNQDGRDWTERRRDRVLNSGNT
jgi:hypothetical protein